jgi:YidC/Oxa1 family membrane protein insertase
MKAMQAIQPQLTALRNKYKSDPQRFQREQMELFRKHGVNPMGGCLPMIVQIPIFYALYLTLQYSVELQGAPFVFWITDLSKKDPFYVLPILMGISMLVQQKMTPTVGDPRQAQIMLIMPVVFTFMFLEFPTGLVLYWLVNNCLSILQQYLIDRSAKPRKPSSRRPAEPRAAAAGPRPAGTSAEGELEGILSTAAGALGLPLPPAFPAQIATYLGELEHWERIGAMTAYREREARIRHLVVESLMLLAALRSRRPRCSISARVPGSGPDPEACAGRRGRGPDRGGTPRGQFSPTRGTATGSGEPRRRMGPVEALGSGPLARRFRTVTMRACGGRLGCRGARRAVPCPGRGARGAARAGAPPTRAWSAA